MNRRGTDTGKVLCGASAGYGGKDPFVLRGGGSTAISVWGPYVHEVMVISWLGCV